MALGAFGATAVVVAGGAWAATSFFATGSQPAEALPDSTVAYASIDLDPSGGQKIVCLPSHRTRRPRASRAARPTKMSSVLVCGAAMMTSFRSGGTSPRIRQPNSRRAVRPMPRKSSTPCLPPPQGPRTRAHSAAGGAAAQLRRLAEAPVSRDRPP